MIWWRKDNYYFRFLIEFDDGIEKNYEGKVVCKVYEYEGKYVIDDYEFLKID